jgi:outer membrane immunogenic protein
MKMRIAIAVVVATCTAQVAIAGDILGPPPNFYDWSGVYVGANLGYGTGNISDTPSGASTSSTQSISGATAGGQIGINFQFRNLVFGVEADGDWSNQQTSQTFPVVNVPWLATARVRIGYAYDRIVVYATGGAGYVQLKSTTVDNVVSSSAHTAWVVGIGQESAITRNVILRFEVLYLQLLGNADNPAAAVSSTQTVYDVIARVGLSYKFDWPIN